MRIFTNKLKVLKTGVVMAVAVVALGLCAFFYMDAVNSSLRDETLQYLSEITRQSANAVELRMEGDLQTLRAIAWMLVDQDGFEGEQEIATLALQVEKTAFKRMGIVMPDGKAYRTDGAQLALGDRDYVRRARTGEATVSSVLTDVVDGEPIYVYAVPIYENGAVVAVLFATNDAMTYSDTLKSRLFDGKSYSYITDTEGNVLLHPSHKDSVPDVENIFNEMGTDARIAATQTEQMRTEMLAGGDGVIEYRRGSERRYMSYMNIRTNAWYMVTCVPASVVASRLSYLSGLTLSACAFVFVLLLGLCGYILHSRERSRSELEQLAYTDRVTGGRNWNGFQVDARRVLAAAGDTPYAMIAFDIDKFKVFNDLFGHEQGNRTMHNIWLALREELSADEPFARTSADNFNVLIRCPSQAQVIERVERINRRVQEMHADFSVQYTLQFSFGVYPIEDKTLSLSLMSDRAGLARRAVKGIHGQMVGFYDATVRDLIIEEKGIENEMVEALAGGQFTVYLQPKYRLSDRTLEGAEALVRWNHPERGLVQPDLFIPLFERNGFIVSLDEFVLDRVCATLAGWLAQGITPVPVAVNISRLHLHDSGFVERIEEIVARHGLPNGYIQLELTENILLDFEHIGDTAQMMRRLKEKGFTFAMDDFGTGYSSLNLLRSLPVDVVKLDKEFFGRDADSVRGRSVVADIIGLAKHLDLTVVAEGVETEEQVAFLWEVGCDIVQGYYFARPMSIPAFEETYWMATPKALPLETTIF